MHLRRAFGLLFVVVAASLSAPSWAVAWTRTVVQSARATVEVEPDATLSILLRLDVEVHAGWLHELELVDLGPDVELDRYRPPYFRSEDGEIFRPEAEQDEDGRIRLWFHRRDAPRKGEYRVFMRYRTKADAQAVEIDGQRRARIVWSVPAWETGLHDVSVEIKAPRGTLVPEEMEDPSPGVDLQVVERPDQTVIRWRRIHLPRMMTWPLTFDAPAESIALAAPVETRPTPNGFRPLHIPEKRDIAWAVILLAVVALLKRRSIEVGRGHGELWIHGSWRWVLPGVAAWVGLAQWLLPTHPAWGLPLMGLALHRAVRGTPRVVSDWCPVPLSALTVADPPDFLDATTPFGAAVLFACTSMLFVAGQPTGALLMLPVFFSGTRHHYEPTHSETITALRRLASELRLPDDAPAMCFRWERASDGFPRLRLHLPTGRVGLLSVSFVLASCSSRFIRRRRIMLRVETRAQSDADDLMRRRSNEDVEVRDEDGSIIRLVSWDDDALELLRVLAREAPKPSKASRGTWILREISEPGRRAA
jgi:hypothetical protein